jgi:hypothetical protein
VLRQIIAVISCCAFLATQSETPERRVQGNMIISMRDPKVLIRLPESIHHVGADRWVLYEIADCELQVL